MSKLAALLQFLLALSGCSLGGSTFIDRIDNPAQTLHSKTRVQDGVARFECLASSSGQCHYTLYPDACGQRADCRLAPLQRFSVARGHDRQIAGLSGFRPCVSVDAALPAADCTQAARPH